MICAVGIDASGHCHERQVRRTRNRLTWESKPLWVHYHSKERGLAVASTRDKQSMLDPDAALFTFPLPAPLNAYIYPKDVVVLRCASNGSFDHLRLPQFEEMCNEMRESIGKDEEEIAVYDVPAVPFTCAESVDDVLEEEEEDDLEDEEYDEEDGAETDDDDWEMDDDDIGPA